ncbi:hypothetical protein ABOM_007422 [Aspergillus bombycis]|uniref:Secreted protein n=1 Tax=Aspergillus bombycis TaxID=109264 RepID=A0A1F7ZYY0_9EURO|nr:hypothetical protein ABOM_007422 [Aspergillus bombycis]OGM44661.1 hypothetical protein ABOM_007422 [Aspergillus bombycis]
MLFTTILASTIALGMGVSAAPTPPANTRIVQLRLYGESGCSALNQGELGVYGDHVNQCQTFPDTTAVKSVSFEFNYQKNCTLAVYNDVTCNLNRHDVKEKTCLSGDEVYGSYIVQCPLA